MTVSDDDRKAFAAAVKGARPLQRRNDTVLDKSRPKPRANQSRAARKAMLEEALTGPGFDAEAEEVGFRRPGLGMRTYRKLRRGEFAIAAEIDLHGLRLEEARQSLKRFLQDCIDGQLACVRVIHGKGTRSGPAGPVLKPSVHLWLSRWNCVLAFVSAQPRHGGSGAIYVLLRR